MDDDDDDDDDDAVEFIPPFEVDPNIYEFIPSLASKGDVVRITTEITVVTLNGAPQTNTSNLKIKQEQDDHRLLGLSLFLELELDIVILSILRSSTKYNLYAIL
ncbi:hypothetical protein Tco_1260020 [Tanacetum coccineum]